MKKRNYNKNQLGYVIGLTVAVLAATSARAIAPPPPSGPPAPVQTGIAISGATSVDEGTTTQLTCLAKYSDGTTKPIVPVWSVDSSAASINASGLFSAGDVVADQDVDVTATYGGFSASQAITIQFVAPVLTGISIVGASVVDEETTAQYSCTASYSDGTTELVAAVWSEDSAYASISASGLFSAGDVAADQNVTITASFGGETATRSVVVKYVAPVLTGLLVSGPAAVDEETTAQYVCIASYSDGTSARVAATWSENSAYASVSGLGLLAAGNVAADQNIILIASYGGMDSMKAVTISYVAPTLTGLAISGPARVDEESSAQYTCTANYSDGTSALVAPVWSQNSGYASIDASGLLVTGDVTVDQNFTITATYGGLADTQVVTLAYVAPPVVLTGISIQGPDLVGENTNVQFVCIATYSDGSSKGVAPAWSEDSAFAAIGAAGVLSVGNIEADASLDIAADFEGKSASFHVAVVAEKTQVSYPLSGFAGKRIKAELWDETAQEWKLLGESEDPSELVITDLVPGCWYWLSIKEYDEVSEGWVEIHNNWISM